MILLLVTIILALGPIWSIGDSATTAVVFTFVLSSVVTKLGYCVPRKLLFFGTSLCICLVTVGSVGALDKFSKLASYKTYICTYSQAILWDFRAFTGSQSNYHAIRESFDTPMGYIVVFILLLILVLFAYWLMRRCLKSPWLRAPFSAQSLIICWLQNPEYYVAGFRIPCRQRYMFVAEYIGHDWVKYATWMLPETYQDDMFAHFIGYSDPRGNCCIKKLTEARLEKELKVLEDDGESESEVDDAETPPGSARLPRYCCQPHQDIR